jgi:Tol biopolymer transport system component
MPDNVKDWEALKRYLLGNVSPEEQQDVERWLISDDHAYDQLEAAEDELIDTFLRGELRGRDLDQFNSHFLIAPERKRKLQFSRSLIRFIDGPLVHERTPFWVAVATSQFRALADAAPILLAVILVASLAVLVPIHRPVSSLPVSSHPEARVEINTPATPQPLHFAISSDGRQLVFVASGDGSPKLWLRPLSTGTAEPLAGTDAAEYPFWSPDGHWIGFFASGKLKKIELGGRLPVIIAEAAAGQGGTWNREGTILYAPTNASPLWRVPSAGGQPVQVTKLDLPQQGSSHRFPQFLPDGKHFLFFSQGSSDAQGIYLGSLDNAQTKRLTLGDSAGEYVERYFAPSWDGASFSLGYVEPWFLFNRQGTLVARRLNPTLDELVGDPVTLADSVSYDTALSLGGFSASSAGNIAYRAAALERRQLKWFDRTGRVLSEVGEPDVNLVNVELSPEGRRAAVVRTLQDSADIWLVDLAGGTPTRLTSDAAKDTQVAWSPDGTRIAFSSNRKGIHVIYIRSSGARAEQPLLESADVKNVVDWSPDGQSILFTDPDRKTGSDAKLAAFRRQFNMLWALPLMGDRRPVFIGNPLLKINRGRVSPDGRWIALETAEAIVVTPMSSNGAIVFETMVSWAGGTAPRWRRDGKELFYMRLDGTLMAVPVRASGSISGSFGLPIPLFQTRAAKGGNANLRQEYAVAPDGRFLIDTVTEPVDVPMTVILNWNPNKLLWKPTP